MSERTSEGEAAPSVDTVLLSRLVDGDLPAAEMRSALEYVLDTPTAHVELRRQMSLRDLTGLWRESQRPLPPLGEMSADVRPSNEARETTAPYSSAHATPARPIQGTHRMMGLVAASLIGGIIVLGGSEALRWAQQGESVGDRIGQGVEPIDSQPAIQRVSREERQQVAAEFAFHESVAGPLFWYAADESAVKLCEANSSASSDLTRPLAVSVRTKVHVDGQVVERNYTVVCRDRMSARIVLPSEESGEQLQFDLAPTIVGERLVLRYSLSVKAPSGDALAVLGGIRDLSSSMTRLGQLASDKQSSEFYAAAWELGGEDHASSSSHGPRLRPSGGTTVEGT